MTDGARYAKIVQWSHEDQCFIGTCPGLMYGGCHGDDEREVFAELCAIVEDAVQSYRDRGRPLSQPTACQLALAKRSRTASAPSTSAQLARAA